MWYCISCIVDNSSRTFSGMNSLKLMQQGKYHIWLLLHLSLALFIKIYLTTKDWTCFDSLAFALNSLATFRKVLSLDEALLFIGSNVYLTPSFSNLYIFFLPKYCAFVILSRSTRWQSHIELNIFNNVHFF